ncbi:MAG: serine protease [Candidatus Colwellbacteria bacterium]|nr:serine protease [Candidatus Colwellbacteria bacterium]
MFSKASKEIREATYGFLATSIVAENGPQKTVNTSNGTAFMVAPGYLVTAAHSVHQEADPSRPVHQGFELIRTPDIGQQMEKAVFVAEDTVHDIALLKIEKPKNSTAVRFEKEIMPRGTNCGFLGFPIANVQFSPDGKRQFNLFERFQGAYVSNYVIANQGQSGERAFYEIDALMYAGSSGCPAFTVDGKVVGMQVASAMQKQKEDNRAERVAISMAVPASEILDFLKVQNINLANQSGPIRAKLRWGEKK